MLREHKNRFLLLAASSTLATTLDFAALLGLVGMRVPPALATIVGSTAGGLTNFLVGRLWVFPSGPTGSTHFMKQLLMYAGAVVFLGAIISGALVTVAMHLGATLVGAKCLAAILTMGLWNYPVSQYVVFRKEETPCFR